MEQVRTFTAEELAQFAGQTSTTPIYISVRGNVYDVSAGRGFYGPGAGYHAFAGKEASRALGKMQVSEEECNAGWTNLNEEHRQTLADWEKRYVEKYPMVGIFKPDPEFESRGNSFQP
jgi:membrane-associated progesterone receptor component